MQKTIYMAFVFILLFSTSPFALTLNKTTIPQTLTVDGTSIVLNGVGLRKKFGFKAYYAGLYLSEKNSDRDKIIQAKKPQAIVMYWNRGADIKKIQLVFLKSLAISANAAPRKVYTMDSDYGIYTKEITDFVSWLSETAVKKKTIWSFYYIPGKGIDVYINDTKTRKFKGTIPGFEFKKILWGVWLAKSQAVGKKMTNDMLGIH